MKLKYYIYIVLMVLALGLMSACEGKHPDEPVVDPYTDEQLAKLAREYVLSTDLQEYDEQDVLAWVEQKDVTLANNASAMSRLQAKISTRPAATAGSSTVLVYIVADNSLNGLDANDVAEMMTGYADKNINPSLNNLLIYQDNKSTNPTIYYLTRSADGTVTQEVLHEYAADHDSASPAVMKGVINKALYCFPAESYGFVYWSHGDGWMTYPLPTKSITPHVEFGRKWIGMDVTRTNITDLAEVLKSTIEKKLDFLMFDACYMLSMETLYDLRKVADFVIGSPTEIPGPGAPYDVIVPEMFGASPPAYGIVQSYYNYYAATYDESARNTNSMWTGGVSVGYARTSQLEYLAEVTKSVLTNYRQNFNLSEVRNSVLNYDRRSFNSTSYIGYYDLCQVMKSLLTDVGYGIWHTAYETVMENFFTTPKNFTAFTQGLFSMEGAQGLSCYLPMTDGSTSGMDKEFQKTSWYKAAGLDALGW